MSRSQFMVLQATRDLASYLSPPDMQVSHTHALLSNPGNNQATIGRPTLIAVRPAQAQGKL
jgi:hypothetical protein